MNKVMIAVPTAEMARHAVFYDHFNMIEKDPGTLIAFTHGQSPAENRNQLIRLALEHNCTHILFIDDDIIMPPDILTKLISHDLDIVSGIYLLRNFPHKPILFDRVDEYGKCLNRFLNKEDGRLIPIVAAGLGACLFKTEVFRTMQPFCPPDDEKCPPTWIRLGELKKDHWSDDIGFFNRVRQFGYKIYADTEVLVGHIASAIVRPERLADGTWATSYDTNGEAKLSFPAVQPTPELV